MKPSKRNDSLAYKAMVIFLPPLKAQNATLNGHYYTGRILDSNLADIKRMASVTMGAVGLDINWRN